MLNIAREVYESQVKPLPIQDRLELARLIMEDLSASASRWIVDSRDEWQDEDLVDLQKASLQYMFQYLEEDDDETW